MFLCLVVVDTYNYSALHIIFIVYVIAEYTYHSVVVMYNSVYVGFANTNPFKYSHFVYVILLSI